MNESECAFSRRESQQVRPIWPCYENENVGRSAFGDWSGSQSSQGLEQVCGWNRYYCARVDGSEKLQSLEWHTSRVLFGEKGEGKKGFRCFASAAFENDKRKAVEDRKKEG